MTTRVVVACSGLALLIAPSISRAANAEQPAFSLAGGVGPHLFVQEGHAPPLCCGERDRWTAAGGQLRVEVTALLGRHLRLFLGGGYAHDLHAAERHGADRLRVFDARLGLDLIAVRHDNVTAGFGLFGALGRVDGTFPRYVAEYAERARVGAGLMGAGLRARVDIFPLFGETTGLAVDVGGAKYMIAQNAWNATVMFVWTP